MATSDGHEPDAPTSGQGFGPLGRVMAPLGIISVIWIIFVAFVPINPWFPQGTYQAVAADGLFRFMLATGGAIIIFVEGLTLAFVVQYRRKKTDPEDALGVQSHGNARVEIAWSAGPAVLLVILAVASLAVWSDEHSSQKSPVRLDVTGFQFGWQFSLPQYGVKNLDGISDIMALPVNRPVYVSERSPDVIHSFWVPEFRAKQDAVPGLVTHMQFTTRQIGTYRVICTEFCGVGHSTMVARIKVVSDADFVTFLRKHHATSLPSGRSSASVINASQSIR
jgi:cytochrome c oxidase subunit 2